MIKANPNAIYPCSKHTYCKGFTDLMLMKEPTNVDLSTINSTNELGWTALMIHACNGNSRMVKYLISVEADANLQNTYGRTALMMAALYSSTDSNNEIVSLLIPVSNANLQNDDGWTALMFAARYNNGETVSMLIPVSDLSIKNNDGDSALKYIDKRYINTIVSSGNIKSPSDLLESAISIAQKQKKEIEELKKDVLLYKSAHDFILDYNRL